MKSSWLAIILLGLTGCSPGYVIQGAYQQSKILLHRQQISEALQGDQLTPEQKAKLDLVLKVREFGRTEMRLTPGGAFTTYSKVDRDILAWIVMGSKPSAFELRTWWFPIVGSVPYKGFFDEEDALEAAKELSSEGFETWVRGTDAMSTLGWFDDPVLSTIFKHGDIEIANTVLHESLHSTVWIKNYVDFNESLANFVGRRGAYEYFQRQANESPSASHKQMSELACNALRGEFEFAAAVTALSDQLGALYSSNKSYEEKIKQRRIIFDRIMLPVRERFPMLRALKEPNNAEIMSLKIYLSDFPLFEAAFRSSNQNWEIFLDLIKQIAKNNEQPPFDQLRAHVGAVPNVNLQELCS